MAATTFAPVQTASTSAPASISAVNNSTATAADSLNIAASEHLWDWLNATGISIAFTTYQTNRLFLVGRNPERRLAVNERLFDKPMGLYRDGDRLIMSTRYQIWELENRLAPGETHQNNDRLYFPSKAYTTGDLNVHDVAIDRNQDLIFVNTDFSCLAKLKAGYSFEPIWQPPFITKLAAEDKCHLNGLAMVDGEPTYVTACSATSEATGWRHHRVGGGVVMHVPSSEVVATGLSMPHSPRFYQGKLWLLNAGTGEFGYLDGGRFVPMTFCPGFVRGLAFCGDFALVGMSKLRSKTFSGLPLEERLTANGLESQCGLVIIDLRTGAIVHWLQMNGLVEELFDVVVLPNTVRPQVLGFQEEDVERLVSFPGSGGLVTTKPTVKRPRVGAKAPIAGLPLASQRSPHPSPLPSREREQETTFLAPLLPPWEKGLGDEGSPVKYQRVYHLNAESLAPYDAMTFPSLQQRWQRKPQLGELMAVSASIEGTMVGFAVAEVDRHQTAEILSLFVDEGYRRQGIGKCLMAQLQQDLRASCAAIHLNYRRTAVTDGMEPILQRLGWQLPRSQFLLAQTTTERISQAPWLHQYPLSSEFAIFPWLELTVDEQRYIERLEYPDGLSPLADGERLEPLNSLGLRYQGQLVGWMVTHRVAVDTIRYSTLFVEPRFRAKARGIALLSAAICRQIASPVPNYKFAVAGENELMLRFVRRHLQPYLTQLSESRRACWQR
jgi:uncharacterized protein (TIGR03032 family)